MDYEDELFKNKIELFLNAAKHILYEEQKSGEFAYDGDINKIAFIIPEGEEDFQMDREVTKLLPKSAMTRITNLWNHGVDFS